jgi:hypothetical protein
MQVSSFSPAGPASALPGSLTPHNPDYIVYHNTMAHWELLRGIEVDISPSYQSGTSGTVLTYTVEITNIGNIDDSYYSTVTDNLGWELAFGIKEVTLAPLSSVSTILKVTIPENALGSTEDNIIVTMTSLDNEVSGKDGCIAHALIVRGVLVMISPAENLAIPGEEVTFFVTVKNIGNASDNFHLYAEDNFGWALTLDNNPLEGILPGEEKRTVLRATIPENATACTRDNITVVTTSQGDPTVSDTDSCIAHAIQIIRGVSVSISPSENDGLPGGVVTFIVTVKNTGNAKDNFDLIVSDLGWGPTLDKKSLAVPAGENRTSKLSVTIPGGAAPGAEDLITVTAISQAENTIRNNASCKARAVAAPPPQPPVDNMPPPTPSLISPTNGANLTDSTPLFDWSDVSDPSGVTYDISITRDAGFASIALQKTGLTASAYELAPAEALAAGTYYWRVRAVDNAGNIGLWSPNWSFTVIAAAPPSPAAFKVSSLIISPSQVSVGEYVSISVTVKNTGDLKGTYTVTLKINGTVEAIENVTLAGGATKSVPFSVVENTEGTYIVEVDGLTGSFSVVAPAQLEVSWVAIIILLVVAVIAAAVFYLKRGKRSRINILRRKLGLVNPLAAREGFIGSR